MGSFIKIYTADSFSITYLEKPLMKGILKNLSTSDDVSLTVVKLVFFGNVKYQFFGLGNRYSLTCIRYWQYSSSRLGKEKKKQTFNNYLIRKNEFVSI